MLPNAHPSHSSTPAIEDRATELDGITLPPTITEHPAWKAIWRKLLTPRTDRVAIASEMEHRDAA